MDDQLASYEEFIGLHSMDDATAERITRTILLQRVIAMYTREILREFKLIHDGSLGVYSESNPPAAHDEDPNMCILSTDIKSSIVTSVNEKALHNLLHFMKLIELMQLVYYDLQC